MVSTHIQDSSNGAAGSRIPVELDIFTAGFGWKEVGHGVSNLEGNIEEFGEPMVPGIYRLMYDIASHSPDAFFPSVAVTFEVREVKERCHIVLVLSPFGYSTYRGS